MFLTISLFSILFVHSAGKTLFEENMFLLEKTLSAFGKALYFYNEDYGFINFDSLFGLRVGQGSLRQILLDKDAKQNATFATKGSYIAQIKKLYTTAEKIANKAFPSVQKTNAEEYKKFYKIIKKPWGVFHHFQKLKPATIDKKLKFVKFDGPRSDHCIHLLLKSNSQGYSSCDVTDYCWEFETQKNLGGYTSTHQVLYFLFGLGEGCGSVFDEWFKKTARSNGVQDFFAEICGNIFQSKREVTETRSISEMDKDLFMEQTLVCSLTGYEDFLTEKYLNVVLNWQTDIGCYGKKIFERIKGPRRRLLFERQLKNGCLVHETGVGTALLGQYIRWIFRKLISDGSI